MAPSQSKHLVQGCQLHTRMRNLGHIVLTLHLDWKNRKCMHHCVCVCVRARVHVHVCMHMYVSMCVGVGVRKFIFTIPSTHTPPHPTPFSSSFFVVSFPRCYFPFIFSVSFSGLFLFPLLSFSALILLWITFI